ncbi:unnamed protein product [Urochloa decumbens]|uniref:Pectinesterase inhibitor domain-containing protein n=1 Tax=Urochloa decumbens TaxID=240449 RepID=A0ABC9BWX6_9POAL
MTFVITAAVVLVSLAGMLIAGEACDNVPTMASADACLTLSNTTERWHALCRETLLNAPATAEVTVYALVATRLAKLWYTDAVGQMDQMLGGTGGTKLPAGEAAALEHCKEKYGEAGRLMAGVVERLLACDMSRVRQEYIDAQVAVGSCQDGLWAYRGSPVSDMVSAGFDLTMVAYLLGAIIVGR